MAKLSLKAAPTFQATVEIPVAGGESVPVVMTFKHRTKTGLAEFIASRVDKSDFDSFKEMVVGWDLEDKFTDDNVREVLENYLGSAVATYRVYVDELTKAKAKN